MYVASLRELVGSAQLVWVRVSTSEKLFSWFAATVVAAGSAVKLRYERVADGEDEVQDLPRGCVIVADVNGLASRGYVQIDEGA